MPDTTRERAGPIAVAAEMSITLVLVLFLATAATAASPPPPPWCLDSGAWPKVCEEEDASDLLKYGIAWSLGLKTEKISRFSGVFFEATSVLTGEPDRLKATTVTGSPVVVAFARVLEVLRDVPCPPRTSSCGGQDPQGSEGEDPATRLLEEDEWAVATTSAPSSRFRHLPRSYQDLETVARDNIERGGRELQRRIGAVLDRFGDKAEEVVRDAGSKVVEAVEAGEYGDALVPGLLVVVAVQTLAIVGLVGVVWRQVKASEAAKRDAAVTSARYAAGRSGTEDRVRLILGDRGRTGEAAEVRRQRSRDEVVVKMDV